MRQNYEIKREIFILLTLTTMQKAMEAKKLQDRVRGSLMAGAIGDALGYPVEFYSSINGIRRKYGDAGITRLDIHDSSCSSGGKAVVSDDTQMTLFTAMGLLNAKQLGVEPKYAVCRAYLEWHSTQSGRPVKSPVSWIMDVKELHANRAPGITCMSSLQTILDGGEPVNNSKGCGGVMRVAPVALFAAVNNRMDIETADRLAGDAAEITHLHPLGYIPAALMSHVIYRLLLDETPTAADLKAYVDEGFETMRRIYPDLHFYIDELKRLVKSALLKVNNGSDDVTNIESIGGGWVGDEALAIALYCAVKYFDNIEHALIASVNHAGDSDSTGAVTGNILGAVAGYDAIPQHFKDDVEMHDVILKVADQLFDYEGI